AARSAARDPASTRCGASSDPRSRSPTRTSRRAASGAFARCGTTGASVDPAVMSILACPRCRASAPFSAARAPRCNACGFEPSPGPAHVLDLIDSGGGEPTVATTEQRLMESELVARVYDRFWRPTFVRLLAGK